MTSSISSMKSPRKKTTRSLKQIPIALMLPMKNIPTAQPPASDLKSPHQMLRHLPRRLAAIQVPIQMMM